MVQGPCQRPCLPAGGQQFQALPATTTGRTWRAAGTRGPARRERCPTLPHSSVCGVPGGRLGEPVIPCWHLAGGLAGGGGGRRLRRGQGCTRRRPGGGGVPLARRAGGPGCTPILQAIAAIYSSDSEPRDVRDQRGPDAARLCQHGRMPVRLRWRWGRWRPAARSPGVGAV